MMVLSNKRKSLPLICLVFIVVAIISATFPINGVATNTPLKNNLTKIPSEPTDFPNNDPKAVEVHVTSAKKDSIGSYHVRGEIKNLSNGTTLQSVKVTAHFYDESSQPVAVTTCCYADPQDIQPGHTSTFDSFAQQEEISGTPASYRLSYAWQIGDVIPDLSLANGLSNPVVSNDAYVEKTDSDVVHCGEKVKGTIKLNANLNCSGDGLVIGSNTVVNMSGYSIKGPGQESSKVGLMIPNNDNVVVVGPGDISNFQAGMLISDASHTNISSLILEKNQIGMFMTGSDNAQVEQNIIKDNNLGIASHSSKSGIYTSNLLNGNVLAGITFVNTKDSTVSQNNIDGSQNGIFADAQSSGNTISMNNVLHNVIDLNNANGLPTNINSNSFSGNSCQVSNPRNLC